MLASALTCAAAIAASACQGGLGVSAPPIIVESELKPGTPVAAMLLKQLESGIDEVGAGVPMLVVEDVKDAAGRILIPKGTPVQGRITGSRREGTLDGLLNRPARLEISIDMTVATDGQPVDLCADPKKPNGSLEFTRFNTGTAEAADTLDKLMADERDQKVLLAMHQLFQNGDAREIEHAKGHARLQSIAQKLSIPGLQNLAQGSDIGKVRVLLDRLRKGSSISRLSPAAKDGPMTIEAIMEMNQVGRKINDRLNKATHGRNIKAYIGTPVTAFVAKAVRVGVKS